jgi:hypothetical protein
MLISLKSLIGSTSQDDYRILVTIYSLLLPICFPSNSSLQAPVIPVIPWTVTGVTRPCFARTQWGCCAARKAPCATPLNNCYPASHTGDMDDSCGWNVDGSIPIDTIFSGMNIHFNPAILGFTRYQGFDPSPNVGDLGGWFGYGSIPQHQNE